LLLNNVDDFLKYDYVGAPWKFQEHGGNGGLSIRDVEVMYQICISCPFEQQDINEDIYFCDIMFNKKIGNLAPRNVCEKFSMETIFKEKTTGYHAIEKYHSKEVVDIILAQEHEPINQNNFLT
jgi:hypothetical protein